MPQHKEGCGGRGGERKVIQRVIMWLGEIFIASWLLSCHRFSPHWAGNQNNDGTCSTSSLDTPELLFWLFLREDVPPTLWPGGHAPSAAAAVVDASEGDSRLYNLIKLLRQGPRTNYRAVQEFDDFLKKKSAVQKLSLRLDSVGAADEWRRSAMRMNSSNLLQNKPFMWMRLRDSLREVSRLSIRFAWNIEQAHRNEVGHDRRIIPFRAIWLFRSTWKRVSNGVFLLSRRRRWSSPCSSSLPPWPWRQLPLPSPPSPDA